MCFRYGSQVLKYLSHDQVARSDLPNPMCTVFPTVTRYGHRILLLIIQPAREARGPEGPAR